MMQREMLGACLRANSKHPLEVGRPHDARETADAAAAGAQTDSRLRPLARRAFTTARPPRVLMRTRKPCVRARRVFEGW